MRSLVVKNLETRVPHNTWLPLNNVKDTRQKPLSHVESWHVLTLLYTHLSYPHMNIPHFWRIPFSLAGTCDSKLPPHDEHGLDEPSGRGRARGTCRAHRFPGRWTMAMGVKFAAILNHHRIPAVLFLGSMQKKTATAVALAFQTNRGSMRSRSKGRPCTSSRQCSWQFSATKASNWVSTERCDVHLFGYCGQLDAFFVHGSYTSPSPRPSSPSLCRLCHLCRLCLSLFHLCLLESGQSGKSSASLVHIYPKLFFQWNGYCRYVFPLLRKSEWFQP